MDRRARFLHIIGLLAWLTAGRPVRAGGFEYGENWAEALGRAGAFVARADNPTALYYNPAGMGRMEPGTHLLADLNLVLRDLSFQRAGEMDFVGGNGFRVDGMPYPEIKDAAGPFPAPFIALVTDFGLDSGFSLGAGVFGPAALGRADLPTQSWVVNHDGERIPIPSANRYDIVYMDILLIWPTLAASYSITDDLVLALSFQPGMTTIKFHTTTVAFGNGDDVVADLRANLDVADWFIPSGMFGIWYRPSPWFELAGSLRLSDGVNATGDVETISNPYGVRAQDPVSSATWTEYNTEFGERPPQAELTFAMPLVVARLGFRFVWPRDEGGIVGDVLDSQIASRLARLAPHEREWLDVELDVTYEMNSSVDSFRTKISGVVPLGYGAPNLAVRPNPENPDDAGVLLVPHNWVDTVALRLGGDVNLLEGAVSLHWGTLFETATVPEEWTRLDFTQWMTFGVAGGVTVRLPWYGLDLTASYLHLFMPDREVTDGKARMLAAIERPEELIPVVNNGNYQVSMDVFSVGIAARF